MDPRKSKREGVRRIPPKEPAEPAMKLTHVTLSRADWETVSDVAKRELSRLRRLEWPRDVSEPWRILGRMAERALLTRGGKSLTVPVPMSYMRDIVELLERGGRRQTAERISGAIGDAMYAKAFGKAA